MFLFLRFRIGELFREMEVRKRYYTNASFAKEDRALKKAYRFRNSFAIARKFHGTHCYGETPLPVLDRLAKKADLTPTDHFFELGAGRGRGALFCKHYIGCKVTAIEVVPTFVQIAREKTSLEILEEDLLSADLSQATCIYLYGTNLPNETIRKFCKKIKNSRAKIVTVSYPLKAYDTSFTTLNLWEEKFPWGRTTLYLNKKI